MLYGKKGLHIQKYIYKEKRKCLRSKDILLKNKIIIIIFKIIFQNTKQTITNTNTSTDIHKHNHIKNRLQKN